MTESLFLGVEEEFFVVDSNTTELIVALPQAVEADLTAVFGEHFTRELFSAQIELSTPKCASIHEVAAALRRNRQQLAAVLAPYGLAFVAVATYPSAICAQKNRTNKARYKKSFIQYAAISDHYLVNGLHFHVECKSKTKRLELLTQLNCFLPLFLAFSASSPFFEGVDTRMQSYRTLLTEGYPLSGIAPQLNHPRDYDKLLKLFTKIGFIDSPSRLYWHLRLGNNLPTLEMRILDACPLVEDTISLAALYVCLAHTLIEQDPRDLPFYTTEAAFMEYGLWQARRVPLSEACVIDFSREDRMPMRTAFAMMLEFIMPTAQKFGCQQEVSRLQTVFTAGTSAMRQRKIYSANSDLNLLNRHLIEESQCI